MEVNALPTIVLLLVSAGLLLGVGLIVHDKFGLAAYSDIDVNENITPSTDALVALSHQNLTAVSQVLNATTLVVLPETNYSINLTFGLFNLTGNETAEGDTGSVWVYYTYRESETPTKLAMDDIVTAEADISSTWLALIVVVIMLAIILGLIITSFTQRGAR